MRLNEQTKHLLLISGAVLLSVIAVWLPFILRLPSFWGIELPRNGMATIIANFDGPYYIVAAKSLYNPQVIEQFQFPLHTEYYSAHFPGFPLLIRALSPFFGYPWAMMIATVLTTILAAWFFYLLLRQLGLAKQALWITIVFAIFPARWLIVHSVGSPEPLFIAAILATFYFFLKGNYWLAGITGAISMLTKSPGILLFAALTLAIWGSKFDQLMLHPLSTLKKLIPPTLPLLLMPLTLLGIFFWYQYTYGDFFTYFHSGDNIHLLFPPFQVFNANQTWVGTFWLEEIIWIYLLGFLGLFQLIKRRSWEMAWFVGIFFASTLFVSHRDIARYTLPIVPFLLIAFNHVLATKEFKWGMALLLIPIYLFALSFISHNITPIADWEPLL
ncbi:hypothetical protein HY404_01325 [Candidatus Microgenomates bacterium]|nr:hypothetical protein [Candidatus Microgenomates bacterium]